MKQPSFEEAIQIIEWYEQRWLIEEFFKALKTGCRMEERQLRSADALEASLRRAVCDGVPICCK